MGALPDDSGLAIGTVLAGRYRIEGVLGTGGMGRVYRGEHTTIGKPVAVKILRGALGRNDEATARFHREAIASARLQHPNIVSVIDFGVLDDGCPYMVMEALEGEHLAARLARERRLPWIDALMIMRGVLLALRHAHDRGVVHRDVKPDNIFLAEKAGQTIVKLFDFGIAKLRVEVAEDQMATRAGIAIGTPTYLSPEQAIGDEITPASDVYSTCIVLYELLVGRAPFESDDPLTLLQAHIGAEVPSFRELAPRLRVPDRVESLVRRGLAKRAGERLGSTELIAELDDILRAHGIDVEPPLFARSSQSIDVPSPLATPVTGTAMQPRGGKPSSGPIAIPATEPPSRRRSPRRSLIVVVALVIAGASVGLAAFLARGGGDRETDAALAKPVNTTPAPAAPTDHETQLKLALRELQDGPSCIARKKAIAKLVELQDSNAVPAIKKARAQFKANACLRAAADQAIKALAGRI